jgi:hypothetical protein
VDFRVLGQAGPVNAGDVNQHLRVDIHHICKLRQALTRPKNLAMSSMRPPSSKPNCSLKLTPQRR